MKVGLIGCGQISSIYLEVSHKFDILEIVACADIDMARAKAQAERYHIPHVYTVEELLQDPEIDIVLNLTIPDAHASIDLAAIEMGMSVYSEKPLAIRREQGKAILEAAQAKQVRVGCAPDTFLGGGIQTCIELINNGAIGRPIAATAFMMGHGPESWHSNPEFFYQPGAGPLFDMGPYYLTALIAMLGPVHSISAMESISFPERMITSQPKKGTMIKVNTPTHVAGMMHFADGLVGTIITSFDVWSHHMPFIEIYGTEGSLSVPDPNTFGGPVSLDRMSDRQWREIPLTHGYTENTRGIGLADMAYAIKTGRPHRASGDLAYHVLDIMQAFHDSSNTGQHIELTSTTTQPEPLTPDWQQLNEQDEMPSEEGERSLMA